MISDQQNSCERRVFERRQQCARLACIGFGLAGLLAMSGCQSAPMLAWQGARHYTSGNAALDRGEPTAAISEFKRAAELVPHASEIRNHLGLAYWAGGQPVRARRAFEVAIDLDCDNEAAKLNLARLDGGLGRDLAGAEDRDATDELNEIDKHAVRSDHRTQGGHPDVE